MSGIDIERHQSKSISMKHCVLDLGDALDFGKDVIVLNTLKCF